MNNTRWAALGAVAAIALTACSSGDSTETSAASEPVSYTHLTLPTNREV